MIALRRALYNLSLNLKISAMLVLAISTLAFILIMLISSSFNRLLLESSRQRLAGEVNLFQQHFSTKQDELSNGARLLASAPGLVEAVEAGNVNTLRTVLLLQGSNLAINQIDVIDSQGERLLTLGNVQSDLSSEAEALLIRSSLFGIATADLIKPPGSDSLLLASVTPLKNARGLVIGSLYVNRPVDNNFMDELDFARLDTHIAFIYEGQLAATDLSKPEELEDAAENVEAIQQALAGEVWISNALAYDDDNTPDILAYAPFSMGEQVRAVIAVRNELGTLLSFQSQILMTTLLAVLAVAALGIVFGILFLRITIIRPLSQLKTASEEIAHGQLDQRTPVRSGDEIGQLAGSFNKMADQVSNLVTLLEGTVKEEQIAREQAERSDKVKSAFLASMSHELRTPLNAIINFTRFVVEGDTGPVNDQQSELLHEVVGSGKHLLDLINDVLDMSKIEAGSLNLFIEDDISMNRLLDKALATSRSLIGAKPIRLTSEIEPNLPLMRADQQRILQILLNILSNACKFTHEGEIRVQASLVDDEILVTIADTGPGIPLEDQSAVFEAFKQTSVGLRQGGGTGLGMPIARSLALAHGGQLWFESQPGKGTTFHVALPVKSAALVPLLA